MLWTDDITLRQWLATLTEPQHEEEEPTLMTTRELMICDRIRQLDALRASLNGRQSRDIDLELASIYYKRRLLHWMKFPIREFPTEILNIIFRYVVWSSAGADEMTLHRLRLTWVCRRFRDVALADQSLWTSVWFRESYPWTRSLAFFERAGTSLVDLRINDKDKAPGDTVQPNPITPTEMNFLVDRLLTKIHQIRIMMLVCNNVETIETFIRRFGSAGEPENLQRYEIHRLANDPRLWPARLARAPSGIITSTLAPLNVSATPKLRDICLNGVSIDWSRLTHLVFRHIDIRRMSAQSCPTPERWTDILRASQHRLFRLTMDAAGPQWLRAHSSPAIVMHNLHELHIAEVVPSFAKWVMESFRAPNLTTLILSNVSGADGLELIEPFIGAFPALKNLTMFTVPVEATPRATLALIRWFEHMPRLVILKLAAAHRIYFDALSADPSVNWHPDDIAAFYKRQRDAGVPEAELRPPVLLPLLQAFLFHSQAGNQVSTFLARRNALGLRLKHVYLPLAYTRGVPEEERKRINENCEKFLIFPPGFEPTEDRIIQSEAIESVPGYNS